MNSRLFYTFLSLYVIIANSFAQNATVTFTTDKDCEVIIYKPIDGEYNNKIPHYSATITSTKPAVYITEIPSYTFVYCQFPQYQKSCNVILFPNDSVQIDITKDDIRFQGSNSNGLQYFYDNFQKRPQIDDIMKMQKIVIEYIEQKRNIQSILPAINDSMRISSYMKEIEELPLTTNTTTKFANVLMTERYMSFYGYIVDMMLYLVHSTEKYTHIAKDCTEIRNMVNGIYQKLPIRLELLKYSSLIYILKYLSFYHGDKECPAGYDPETFGPYKMYLYAPEDMQPGLLGGACMTQLKYNSGEMNLIKLKQFFNERFPNSEYAAIINQKVQDESDSVDVAPEKTYFIKERIDSLSQLKNIQGLKGKYLFIDLWASWCMPCRAEFSYRSKLDELLNTYSNITTVYISIDGEKQEKAWLNCVEYYKLEGYHLRATSALQEDIKKNVYGKEQFEIPRYLLISPDGKILNRDLPRPSEYPQLKEALEDIMK